jgi:hypothetical protein
MHLRYLGPSARNVSFESGDTPKYVHVYCTLKIWLKRRTLLEHHLNRRSSWMPLPTLPEQSASIQSMASAANQCISKCRAACWKLSSAGCRCQSSKHVPFRRGTAVILLPAANKETQTLLSYPILLQTHTTRCFQSPSISLQLLVSARSEKTYNAYETYCM